MTARALVLGLLGAVFIAGFGYINDFRLQNTYLVGNHFPITVFGLLALAAFAINPVLARLRACWPLRPTELAIIITFMLAACTVPSSGLMRTFGTMLVMPVQFNQVRPAWQANHLLEYIPPDLLPAGGVYDARTIGGYVNGLGRPGRHVGVSDVPWDQWATPLATWLPLVALLSAAVICLAVIVHRQWSRHEHLRYPIAVFAASLMDAGDEGHAPPVYRQRIFWVGVLIVLGIHLVNGLAAWYPQSIRIPMTISFAPVLQAWPGLRNVPGAMPLLNVNIFPTVIAFGFLLAAEVSLSLGIGPFLQALAGAALLRAGVDFSGWQFSGVLTWQLFGSYLGLAIMIAYAGRHYYRQVARGALTGRAEPGTDRAAIWALRILLVAVAGAVALLARAGLDWPLGLLAVLILLMMFLVMARLNAESGLFFVQPYWHPVSVVLGLFGAAALGPKAIAILAMLGAIMAIDPRESLMPFVINALKIGEDHQVRPSRVGWWMAGAFGLALAVAVPVVLWSNYSDGVPADGWGCTMAPNMVYGVLLGSVTDLSVTDELQKSVGLTIWQRFANMGPNTPFLWSAGTGVALVLVFGALRLRFARFPLHPVMFLVWNTYAMWMFSYSFLLGWLVKRSVTRYGGAAAYSQTTRFMFGVIVGDLLGGLIFMVVGAVYYFVMGVAPTTYRVFPN